MRPMKTCHFNLVNIHITRVYQLLIWGKLRPSSGKIDTFITRSSKNRQMMEVSISKEREQLLIIKQ